MSLSDKIVQVRGRTPANEMNGLFDAEVLGIIDVRESVRKIKKFIEDEHEKINGTLIKDCGHKGNCWAHDYLSFIDEEMGEKLI